MVNFHNDHDEDLMIFVLPAKCFTSRLLVERRNPSQINVEWNDADRYTYMMF